MSTRTRIGEVLDDRDGPPLADELLDLEGPAWPDRLRDLADRSGLLLPVVAVVVAGAVAYAVASTATQTPPVEDLLPRAVAPLPTSVASTDPATTGRVVVHVSGAVARPGLVDLVDGERVADAIDAAGGASPAADLDQLNLADLVFDGQRIHVPVEGEPVAQGGAPTGVDVGRGPVDLNRATESDLQALPGVGPVTAAAIVEHRARTGGFVSVDDLMAVPGIGEAKLAAIRDLVVVR